MNLQPPICATEAQIQAALMDPKRLAAVRDSGLLDSPPEESFDRLTRLAAKLTGAPVTFVSLVDAGRDFYKSAIGLGEPLSTTRQLSGRTFCHHALVAKEALILEDVTQLPVFREVPTVELSRDQSLCRHSPENRGRRSAGKFLRSGFQTQTVD